MKGRKQCTGPRAVRKRAIFSEAMLFDLCMIWRQVLENVLKPSLVGYYSIVLFLSARVSNAASSCAMGSLLECAVPSLHVLCRCGYIMPRDARGFFAAAKVVMACK